MLSTNARDTHTTFGRLDVPITGGFFLYANGTQNPAVVVPAKHNTAIICDGTTMPHGTQTYLPDAPLPPITKDGAVFSVQYVDGSAEQVCSWRSGRQTVVGCS